MGALPLIVGCGRRAWQVKDAQDLKKVLAWRDSRGGAAFWLSREAVEYPCLAIRVTGDIADVHFLPEDGHPGFRCLGGEGLPRGGFTTLVYEGCDPGSGEETPNEFVISFETACSIATEFFHSERMSETVSWFEL
jgi:hypothetical protein